MHHDHAYPDRQRFLRAEQHPTRLSPLAVGLIFGAVILATRLVLNGWPA